MCDCTQSYFTIYCIKSQGEDDRSAHRKGVPINTIHILPMGRIPIQKANGEKFSAPLAELGMQLTVSATAAVGMSAAGMV